MADLTRIAEEASGKGYPYGLLAGCKNALFLFGAGFLGSNDVYWAYKLGVPSTIVDLDQSKLTQMKGLYRRDWEYVYDNAFQFARTQIKRKWDFVSVDPSTNLIPESIENIRLWIDRANKHVVIGYMGEEIEELPLGWSVTQIIPRSPEISWLVLSNERFV